MIVIGGLAEMAAGSIAMDMGGFLAARSDADSYGAEVQRERQEIEGVSALKSAGQTVLVGGLAAGAAYLIARAISGVGG